MKKLFYIHIALLVALFAMLSSFVSAAEFELYPETGASQEQSFQDSVSFDDMVAAYRSGQYQQAVEGFSTLCRQNPDSAIYHYYYGISLARVGQYALARDAYQQAIALAPNTAIAAKAQKGLSYLPEGENGLDAPPEPTQIAQNNSTQNPMGGGDNSKMMQMLMMMSMMGGGKGGGNNMMMMPMMQQMFSGKPAKPGDENYISPEVMSQMMQQQMFEDLSPFDSGKDK